ncbi:MAG: alpha/beta hydrolase [Elusimicrobia bacterium]|nr:alpha/beta hydrolase [Elusimicrobiota bacterium]
MIEVEGRGLPIVFVHGGAGSQEVWGEQLKYLRSRHRAIALDLPGHGKSAPAGEALFATSIHLESALDELKLDRFVLVGHSMGGYSIIEYARRHPRRVAGLLLVDPAGDYRNLSEKDQIASAMRDSKRRGEFWEALLSGAKPATRALVLSDLKATPVTTFAAISTELFSYDPVTPLMGYAGPKISVFSPCGEEAQALHNLIPSLPRRRVDGVSHWVMLDEPAKFNSIMDEFLKTMDIR